LHEARAPFDPHPEPTVSKILTSLVALAVALAAAPAISLAATGPVSGPRAKAHIIERLKHSRNVTIKSGPWKSELRGKKGDVIRRFKISNLRRVPIGPAATGLRGNEVHGFLDTQTGTVRTTYVATPGRTPPPLLHTTLPVQPRVLRAP
jgi:hypothetical protein